METVVTIGFDIAKSVFQVHGIDATGAVVVRRKLARGRVLTFFEALPRCQIGMETEVGRRLMAIPGVGPLLASAFVASVADPTVFKTGRDLAAWIGLVPKQNSSGGKERLGGISRAGNRYLRQMLVVGAMAVIRHAQRHGTKRAWLLQLLARRATKVAAVAVANKTARMVWALMTSGERYREPVVTLA